ncbi:hypothetical protein B0H16DRAFT_1706135 [Mycena metata]|uniref:Uncharacterized protein n=1 Tax=Mycena metata TaxID=1033252 RepID=A0AAD7GJH8_9AGAR|nr:hypothetical protein B0H16DRAFT_1706135 [Mycena metata]
MILRRVLEYEHAKCTQLAIIDCSARCRYEGYFANAAASEENLFKDHDEQPTKRRKITVPPLGNQVVNAEAIKAILIDWQPYTAGLRDFRNNIFFTIQQLIEAIEYLDGRTEFQKIFFPFKEEFAVTTVRDMYDMERSLNPDGFFHWASYHLNSLLHNAEANFLQACTTFFRATQNYELAFILEEILSMQFRDNMGVMQLLRGGFLATSHDLNGGIYDSTYRNLRDRFAEFDNIDLSTTIGATPPNYMPTFRTRHPASRFDSTVPRERYSGRIYDVHDMVIKNPYARFITSSLVPHVYTTGSSLTNINPE